MLRRLLSRLLIHGLDAAFIRSDLEAGLEHDIARGVGPVKARWRYVINVVASSWSLLRARVRMPEVGVSRLDVVLGLRLLRKQPGLTVVAILALAIGIPVGLAPMHGAIALEMPPPFEDGERMQVLKYWNTATSQWARPSIYDYTVWREELRSFDALAVTTHGSSHNLGLEDGRASPVRGASVTASAFDIVRVPALLGRTLTVADEGVGAARVVVISHDLWQARLGGGGDAIGRIVRIDGAPHEIVGVMPEGFNFPIGDQLWLPLRLNAATDDHTELVSILFGRLAEGVTAAEAQAEIETLAGRLAAEYPELHARLRAEVVSFTTGLFGMPKDGLNATIEFYFFQLLALLVLTVACVNIGMLFLARTATRASEMAVRTALGASRARVVSQLFTESLVLAVIAAGLGLIAGDIAANRAFGWLTNSVPNWIDLGVTPRTFLLAMSLAVFSAAVIGVIPALRFTGRSVQRNIQRAAANRSGVRFGGLSSTLIVLDVMLAVATLGVALATSNQFMRTRNGMGIDAQRYLSANVELPATQQAQGDGNEATPVARDAAKQEELVRRIREEPEVRGVAVADLLPGMDHPGTNIVIEGEILAGDSEGHRIRAARVDIGYFDALESPILSGRGFTANDLGESVHTVIVNTSFVERVLGGRYPIGHRIRYVSRTREAEGPWYEIVGVVGHLGMFELNPDLDEGLYHPLPSSALAAEARSRGEPAGRHAIRMAILTDMDARAFASRLRTISAEVDPAAIVSGVQRLDQVFSFDRYTIGWIRLGALALVAILLAMSVSGTYALMSFTVSQRTREIGIRTALGERRSSLVLTIARRALAQLGVGVALGLIVLGLLLADLNSQLQRSTGELVLLAAAVGVAVMLAVSLIACVAPTRRALRIMPVDALRS
jgi:predicted permease